MYDNNDKIVIQALVNAFFRSQKIQNEIKRMTGPEDSPGHSRHTLKNNENKNTLKLNIIFFAAGDTLLGVEKRHFISFRNGFSIFLN